MSASAVMNIWCVYANVKAQLLPVLSNLSNFLDNNFKSDALCRMCLDEKGEYFYGHSINNL